MSRLLIFCCLVACLSSCDKKRVSNRIDGRWVFVKLLDPKGSYSAHSDIYEFTGGKNNTKSDFPFTIYGQDTIPMLYRVTKGNIIQVTNPENGTQFNWLIEDMDKSSLVVRVAHGVMFFEKE